MEEVETMASAVAQKHSKVEVLMYVDCAGLIIKLTFPTRIYIALWKMELKAKKPC